MKLWLKWSLGLGLAALAAGLALWLCALLLNQELSRPMGQRLVLAADGSLLGELGARDHICGPLLEPGAIPVLVRSAALAAEDQRFFWHPGVDPLALVRAARQNLKARRIVSGGSTITMQLVRLLRPAPRSMLNKMREACLALGLEMHLSKKQILAHYLNRAPFGGALMGMGAASRQLLHKDPARLSPAEAALLMALPQRPARLLDSKSHKSLLKRQSHILARMQQNQDTPNEFAGLRSPLLETVRLRRFSSPAPHFVRLLGRAAPARGGRFIHTYIDTSLQTQIARLAAGLRQRAPARNLRQAAVVVLRNSDRAVLAWVGSADFSDPASGQVDGVSSRRQPGSALKPFIYALALEEGRSLNEPISDQPMGMLVAGGIFRPMNYDHRFAGRTSLAVALASSLNLPSLRLTGQVGPAKVVGLFRQLGLGLSKPASHYGQGLALGNGEVDLLSLTNAYASLARKGLHGSPRLWQGQDTGEEEPVLSAEACRRISIALDDDHARARGFGRHSLLELPFPASVKTGTSQRHRDNWCLGYTQEHTVGVWVGNFEGAPMSGVTGVTGAAPIWRRVMLMLAKDRTRQPSRGLHADPRPGNAPSPPGQAPRPLLKILVPHDGGVYARDPDTPAELQSLTCRYQFMGQAAPLREPLWYLNGEPLEPRSPNQAPRLPLIPGEHTLELKAKNQPQTLALARFTVLP